MKMKTKREVLVGGTNLLAQLVDSDDEENEESKNESKEEDEDESVEEDSEDESAEEEDHTEEEEESEDEEEVYNKRTSFIATFFNNKEIKEEVPVKCEDPGPCLVTCKIKGVEVRECLCVLGACSSVIPYELYKFSKLRPLKKIKEIFTTADASIVSVVGIVENILKSLHQLEESKGKESPGGKAKMRKTPRGRISNEKGTRNTPTQSKGKKKKISLNTEKKKKKKKEPDEGSTQKRRTLKCLSFDGLLGKLTVLKNVLRRNKNIDTHL
ncbi:hypothetical protein PIB30_093589, partial [Stylosanthes scabra]|nr:hypothetical protein [Stylosanthes scabra]